MANPSAEHVGSNAASLEVAGLGRVEQVIYEHLTGVGSIDIATLSARVDLDSTLVAEAVNALVEMGLAVRDARAGLVTCNPPEGALEAALRQRERELHAAFAELRRLSNRYRSLPRSGDATGLLEIVRGAEAISRRFAQLHDEVEKEVLVFVRPPYVVEDENDAEKELLASGLSARAVYDVDVLETPEAVAALRRNMQRGEQARLMRGLPVKGMIVDGKRAFLPLSLTPADPVFAVVDATGLMEALTTAFEILWTRAIPLLPWGDDSVRPATEHPAGYVDPVDRKILSLLLAGLTDDAVARTLSLGTRTVQRRIRSLMDQLGAQTRLQLGWTVSQLGLLDRADAQSTR